VKTEKEKMETVEGMELNDQFKGNYEKKGLNGHFNWDEREGPERD
jgi:hypothetical protein